MDDQLSSALTFFIGTFTELALLFVLISFLVGLINQWLPPARVQRLLSGNRGYGVAVALGSVTPFCSCSTLPMTTGLLQARAAFGPVMAFLFISPLMNPFIVGLFWVSFGAAITLVYMLFTLVLAIGGGFLLEKLNFQEFIRPELLSAAPKRSCSGSSETSRGIDWRATLRSALAQFRSFIPYMIVGVGFGAVLHGYVPEAFFQNQAAADAWWLIPLAAALGVFLYVRAATMVPIAASLAAKGMSMGAIMSLTIGGAGASLPEMIMLHRMFRLPLLLAFILLVFTTACITGFTINATIVN